MQRSRLIDQCPGSLSFRRITSSRNLEDQDYPQEGKVMRLIKVERAHAFNIAEKALDVSSRCSSLDLE